MDAKLNQSDLISLLAKECNISVAKAEVFTKNFFDIIIEGLEQDGIVKINGLGTFKVTDVASRGSVNVNTGEKIEIKGHRKLTFIPADALKEQVNMPFAMFEPVEVDETYQPDSAEENDVDAEVTEPAVEVAEAEEVLPAVAEENESADTVNEELPVIVEDTPAEEETASEDSNDDTVANEEQVEVAVEEDCVVPQPEEEKVEDAPEQESEEEPVVVQERPTEPVVVRVPPKKSAQEKQTAPSKRKKSGWRYSLIAIMAIAVAFILINRTADKSVVVEDAKVIAKPVAVEPEIEPVAENTDADAAIMQPELPTVAENVEPVIAEEVSNEAEKVKAPAQTVIEQEPADEYEFVLLDELAAKNLKYITPADTLLYVADGDLAVHKVAQDETLTKIAREYYGDKKLWPYIVKYNNMTDPNGLCRGMEIAIPRLKPRK
jgi:nucleoid DNA-binding protein/nucleoid-associated protein YgaU